LREELIPEGFYIKYPRSMNRIILFIGGERKPMLTLLCIVVAILWFSGINWRTWVVAGVMWFVVHGILIWLAQKDECACDITFRSVVGFRFPLRMPFHARPYRS
jgi:type IV secretory pathway TrbD component